MDYGAREKLTGEATLKQSQRCMVESGLSVYLNPFESFVIFWAEWWRKESGE